MNTRRCRRATASRTLSTTRCGGSRRPRRRIGGVPGRLSSGVSISSGKTVVTPTPSAASSERIESAKPTTPNFAAAYAERCGQPCSAAVEARRTT